MAAIEDINTAFCQVLPDCHHEPVTATTAASNSASAALAATTRAPKPAGCAPANRYSRFLAAASNNTAPAEKSDRVGDRQSGNPQAGFLHDDRQRHVDRRHREGHQERRAVVRNGVKVALYEVEYGDAYQPCRIAGEHTAREPRPGGGERHALQRYLNDLLSEKQVKHGRRQHQCDDQPERAREGLTERLDIAGRGIAAHAGEVSGNHGHREDAERELPEHQGVGQRRRAAVFQPGGEHQRHLLRDRENGSGCHHRYPLAHDAAHPRIGPVPIGTQVVAAPQEQRQLAHYPTDTAGEDTHAGREQPPMAVEQENRGDHIDREQQRRQSGNHEQVVAVEDRHQYRSHAYQQQVGKHQPKQLRGQRHLPRFRESQHDPHHRARAQHGERDDHHHRYREQGQHPANQDARVTVIRVALALQCPRQLRNQGR